MTLVKVTFFNRILNFKDFKLSLLLYRNDTSPFTINLNRRIQKLTITELLTFRNLYKSNENMINDEIRQNLIDKVLKK